LPLRREMGDDHEGHAGVAGYGAEQGFERFHPARRSANADDGEPLVHAVTIGKEGPRTVPAAPQQAYASQTGFQSVMRKIRAFRWSPCSVVAATRRFRLARPE